MLDVRLILDNPERIKEGIAQKKEKGDVDSILLLETSRKEIISKVEVLKAERNKVSKDVGLAKKSGQPADDIIAKMKSVSENIKELDRELDDVSQNLRVKLLEICNMPHSSTPVGKSEDDNVVVREWGESKKRDYKPKNHIEISEKLDILDFKRGTKLAGSGFVIHKGLGARLERALLNFFLDTHTKNGFTEIFPPFLVKPECAEGTGMLPKFRDQMYYVNEDDLFLIPTAELPVTNMYRDEILNHKDLPQKFCAYSACFRREAGSWGKDTRGFLRVHEFNKVEMVKFTEPETSYTELESLLNSAEELLKALGLKYRVLELCTGDISFAAAKCYDLEVFAEGEQRWLEVSSCSNFEDFQARRANIRYRNKDGKTKFLHTLNGSGLATARIIVAIIENYQKEDGTIEIPEVLKPYMGVSSGIIG